MSSTKNKSSNNNNVDPITISEVPLALPPRDLPRPLGHKTLIDLIDEKRPRDAQGNPILPTRRKSKSTTNYTSNSQREGKEPEGGGEVEEEDEEEDLIGPFATAFFYTVPLTFLLAAFEVVVHQQYIQEVLLNLIAIKCLKAFPIFLTLIYTIHPHRLRPLIQFCFFIFSIVAGCWLIHATNKEGYYAVMRKAPPVGALWIWAAAEMELPWLLTSCAAVAGWVWWGGYDIV